MKGIKRRRTGSATRHDHRKIPGGRTLCYPPSTELEISAKDSEKRNTVHRGNEYKPRPFAFNHGSRVTCWMRERDYFVVGAGNLTTKCYGSNNKLRHYRLGKKIMVKNLKNERRHPPTHPRRLWLTIRSTIDCNSMGRLLTDWLARLHS